MSSNQIQFIDSEAGKVLKCPDYFDISNAALLHDQLSQLMQQKPARVIFDCEQVGIIDTAILQTLYAFIQSARLASIDVCWEHVNDVVRQGAQTLGMSDQLNMSIGT